MNYVYIYMDDVFNLNISKYIAIPLMDPFFASQLEVLSNNC